MSWQLSKIINRSLAKVHIEDARTSLQTSPVWVWLSGWKSHNLGLAMDVSKVSWVWLRREHHKLASLSSVVFLYFRFHKNHEVKGSGKQNKEHEKENRKGIWRMTSTSSEDLVWFSWQVSSCSSDRRRHPEFLFIHSYSTWQDCIAEIQSWGHQFAALASGSSSEEHWQATVNLLLEPINLAEEDLQLVMKANLLCSPCISDQNIQGFCFFYTSQRWSVLLKCNLKAIKREPLRTHCAFAKGVRPRQGTYSRAEW